MIFNNDFIGRRNAANILKAFGQDKGNCPPVEDLLQKAEGSRGGKVIGHTKSGKPIYDTFGHEGHKKYSLTEHKDAVSAHATITSKLIGKKESKKENFTKEDASALKHHGEQAKLHFNASKDDYKSNIKVLAHTKTGDKIVRHEGKKYKLTTDRYGLESGGHIETPEENKKRVAEMDEQPSRAAKVDANRAARHKNI